MISLLLAAFFLVSALVIYGVFIKPEYELVITLRAALAGKLRLLKEQERIITSVQNLLAQYEGAARIQEGVSLALPEGEEGAAIFNQINALVSGNGLRLLSFDLANLPARPAPAESLIVEDLGVLEAALRLSGSYANFKKFIEGIETNIRLMDVETIHIEKDNYVVVLKTYYQFP